jgi:hypothetical protein
MLDPEVSQDLELDPDIEIDRDLNILARTKTTVKITLRRE